MNKFFTVLILLILSFVGYGVYSKIEEDNKKNEKRVICQEKTVTFEKIVNKNLINEAIKLLETKNYNIKSRIEQSKYMKSKILDYITLEKANLYLENSLKRYFIKSENLENKLLIDYYIYENDKEDKGKKSSKAKLYAGYLVFEFKLENQLIYKIQTDYMKINTSDIPERMDCVIKSFITLKGK